MKETRDLSIRIAKRINLPRSVNRNMVHFMSRSIRPTSIIIIHKVPLIAALSKYIPMINRFPIILCSVHYPPYRPYSLTDSIIARTFEGGVFTGISHPGMRMKPRG
jgi:hypothetical protein